MVNKKNVLNVLESIVSFDISFEEYLILLVDPKGVGVVDMLLSTMISDYNGKLKSLQDKGFLTEDFNLTPKAYALEGMHENARDFDDFWKSYPTSDK